MTIRPVLRPSPALSGAALVFAVVLGMCLFGILTRPVGFLAAFWPANAALLGLFVRCPSLARPSGWIAAAAGYFAADLITGGALMLTAWLTLANMLGVVVSFALFMRLDEADRRLQRPRSVLYLFGILATGAAAAALVGAVAAPLYFNNDLLHGAAFWFTTELANGIIVTPVILTAPRLPVSLPQARRPCDYGVLVRTATPAVALAMSLVIGFLVGGPGAVAFPAPALLWCALTYPLFPTVLLTMLVSIWHLVAISLGIVSPGVAQLDGPTMSTRLGIMLLALGPMTVASINMAKNELLKRLESLVTYDPLTGALTRATVLQRGAEAIARSTEGATCAVMMLDIDHFKSVNDTYGHFAGDQVLRAFSQAARQSLRSGDLFGRLGGEEFAAILPLTQGAEDAVLVAERLRGRIESLRIPVDGVPPLEITVSIGLTLQVPAGAETLDSLLSAADQALYQAKTGGRNRVVQAAH